MKNIIALVLLCNILLVARTAAAQSSFFIQNNLGVSLSLEVSQVGPVTLPSNEYSLLAATLDPWDTKTEVLSVQRGTLANGDTAIFDLRAIAATDTMHLLMMVTGRPSGTALSFAASGDPSAADWKDNSYFNDYQVTVAGKPTIIRFKAENSDASQSRDVRFAIQEEDFYTIDPADFNNPNVINVMSYNIKLMPLITSNFYQRATSMPQYLSPYQDVVIFQEVFDDNSRTNYLEPVMRGQGFSYNSGILNSTSLPHINTVVSGGVIIFSKWPIEKADEMKYEGCAPAASDCLASKGVKYAVVNKRGQLYHIFGSHMEAGGQADDVIVKKQQYGEMRDFINAQNIPANEAVLLGGDFNVSPKSSDNLFQYALDSMKPLIPEHTGYPNSTFSGTPGKIIDVVWAWRDNLVPYNSMNAIITIRGIDSLMWDIVEFSDHRTAISRFEYPGPAEGYQTANLCPGESLDLEMNTLSGVSYQWTKMAPPSTVKPIQAILLAPLLMRTMATMPAKQTILLFSAALPIP